MPCRSARPPIGPCGTRCSELPLRSTVELGREENRSVLQNLVGPAKVPVFLLGFLHALGLVGRETRSMTSVDLGPANQMAQRLRGHSQLSRHRRDRGPVRGEVVNVVDDHPHRPVPMGTCFDCYNKYANLNHIHIKFTSLLLHLCTICGTIHARTEATKETA